jgi:protein TonB
VNPLLIRFPSLLAALERARLNRQHFARLLNDRPIDVTVRTRVKAPSANLHAGYGLRVVKCAGVVIAILTTSFLGLPALRVPEAQARKEQVVIQMDEIPETRQLVRPPPPPRPAVPIETDDADVPDDVTIESTDLDFDDVTFDLPPAPAQMATEVPLEEEPIEFWAVEDKPEITKQIAPLYPEVARKAGIQGTILVRVLIGVNGKVQKAEVLRGKTIFHKAALKAVKGYEFSPARQNDRPVPVWMALPIRFRLVS